MTGGTVISRGIACAALAILLAGVAPAAAKTDAPPPRPVLLVEGDCDAIGATVEQLTDATYPTGDHAGTASAIVAETSFTRVNASLEAILGAPHAVVVLTSADDPTALSCGEVGGIEDELGALIIGLRETGMSNYAGIAFIAPDTETGGSSISLFVAPDSDPNAPPTP
ncbi:MAG: hypothetical protein ACR2J8_03365, partial [Thermomicrobiales bacterium]